MKKTVINTLLCATALMFGISCSKTVDTGINGPQLEVFSLSATLPGPGSDTKVALGDNGVSPLWEEGDTILVLDENKKPLGTDGIFTLTDGKNTQTGTFTGKKNLGQVPCYAIYPASVYNATTGKGILRQNQDGTKGPAFKNIAVMLGIVNNEIGFTSTFTNACSVLKFNTGDYGKDGGDHPAIKSVTVSAASAIAGEFTIDWENLSISPTNDGNVFKKVTVTAVGEGGYADGTDIYIPVIPANQQKFDFEFANMESRLASVSETFAADANIIYDLGIAQNMEFLMLSGEFSVSATKKVRFSRGSLYWDGNEFLLETDQLSFAKTWDQFHVSHLFWSKDSTKVYQKDYDDPAANENDVLFTNGTIDTPNTEFSVNGVKGKFRMLYGDEWTYLLETRQGPDKIILSFAPAQVEGKDGMLLDGMLLFPDKYIHPEGLKKIESANSKWGTSTSDNIYSEEDLKKMENAGAVFIPAMGGRNGNVVKNETNYLFSTTATSTSEVSSSYFFSTPYWSYGSTAVGRNKGYGFRLVQDVVK